MLKEPCTYVISKLCRFWLNVRIHVIKETIVYILKKCLFKGILTNKAKVCNNSVNSIESEHVA